MTDLVGTCPKAFWPEWIAEGDAAGEPESGTEWAWYTRDRLAPTIQPGERFYIVAHGLLRGYAPVTRVLTMGAGFHSQNFAICRKGGAVAVTIDEPIPGFRGLRRRWWPREAERPFPNWRHPDGGNSAPTLLALMERDVNG